MHKVTLCAPLPDILMEFLIALWQFFKVRQTLWPFESAFICHGRGVEIKNSFILLLECEKGQRLSERIENILRSAD